MRYFRRWSPSVRSDFRSLQNFGSLFVAGLSRPRTALRTAFLLLAVLLGFPAAAAAQDPFADVKREMQTEPSIDIRLLPREEQAAARKKFYDAREQKLKKLFQPRLRTFGDLRQALRLTEWRDGEKSERDLELSESDGRLRYWIAKKLLDRIHRIVKYGDDDSKAAVANLATEIGLTIRAALDPSLKPKEDDLDRLDRARRAGFGRSLTDDMIELTRSDCAFVRLHALRALGGINPDPKKAADIFGAVLTSDSDVKARRVAADSLLRLIGIARYLMDQKLKGKGEVEADPADVLLADVEVVRQAPLGLGDADCVVRAQSAEALHSGAEALASLVQRVEVKEEERAKALKVPISMTFTPAGASALKDLLKEFDSAGARIAATLHDPKVDVRLPLVQALERLSDARYRLNQEPITIAVNLEKALDKYKLIPPKGADPLSYFAKGDWHTVQQLLGDPDARVRRNTVRFFEFFREARPDVVADLIRALCDPDRFVRWSAARALGVFSENYKPRDATLAAHALGKLLFDTEFDVRLAAAATLELMREYAEGAVPMLGRAVHFGDPENRVAALYVVQSTGPERTLPLLPSVTKALEDQDVRVRRAAAETLGKYGPLANNKMTIAALRRALGDEDQEVRINASEALLQILESETSGKEKE
jgi:hypothetical protein